MRQEPGFAGYEGRRKYYADPATAVERFAQACKEAEAYCERYNYDTSVFMNSLGFYFTRETQWCEASIDQLYVALKRFRKAPGSRRKNKT